MGLRRLLEIGVWDVVHPAGLAIFLAALSMALLLRKGFCGYVCPVGLASGLLNHLGRKLNLSRVPGPRVDILLHAPKYALLAFFLYTVFVGMDLRAVERFSSNPYNFAADARMLAFFLDPSALTLMVLPGLAVFGVLLRSAWCRYLCPYGALLGLLSWAGPVRIRRDKDVCVQCARCSASCPGGIPVHLKDDVRSPECVGCMRCQSVCPVPECVTLRVGGRSLPFWSIGLGCVLLLLAVWLLADSQGLWHQNLPENMLRMMYRQAF
jgi:polyferredoxin